MHRVGDRSGAAGEGLGSLTLPSDVVHVRTTPVFTATTVPAGLLATHRVAAGVWGRLRVDAGELTFVVEQSGERRRLGAGETQVIEPEVAHHVEPGSGARFAVELYRPRRPP